MHENGHSEEEKQHQDYIMPSGQDEVTCKVIKTVLVDLTPAMSCMQDIINMNLPLIRAICIQCEECKQ